MSKEEVCKLFLDAAVLENATLIRQSIIDEVKSIGKPCSLTSEEGEMLFCGEWSLARLAWLSQLADKLSDPGFRDALNPLIDNLVEQLSFLYKDDPMAYSNYCFIADAYDKGERDSAGLIMGPGPIISLRYEKNLKTLRPNRRFSLFKFDRNPSDEEGLLIMTLGDTQCWPRSLDLDEALAEILKTFQ